MSNLIKFFLLLIFIVVIWSINSFLLPIVTKDVDTISQFKKELLFKQSFDSASPAKLSQSLDQFIPRKFDKTQIIDLIAVFAQESGVEISSLDVQAERLRASSSEVDVINNNVTTDTTNISQQQLSKSNTLKSVKLNISIKGNKNSIDIFISKLANSRPYIDIQSIDITFNKLLLGSGVQDITSIITSNIYYITL